MKKRIKGLVLAICVLSMLFGMNALAYENQWALTNPSGVNIRQETSTKSKIVASVEGNKEIEVYGEVKDDKGVVWYKVYVDSKTTGYVRGDVATLTGKKTGNVTPDDGQGEGTPATEYDMTLATVTLGTGTLVPDFNQNVYEYTLTVAEDTTKIAVYAITNSDQVTIPENVSFRDLVPGVNDRYIELTAPDGTKVAYHFTVICGSEEAGKPAVDVAPDTDEQKESAQTDDKKNDTTKTKTQVKTKLGGWVWLIILMVIIIILLGLACVYLYIQVRDMHETIQALERDRKRFKKKIKELTSQKKEEEEKKPIMKSIIPTYQEPERKELRAEFDDTKIFTPISEPRVEDIPEVTYVEPSEEDSEEEGIEAQGTSEMTYEAMAETLTETSSPEGMEGMSDVTEDAEPAEASAPAIEVREEPIPVMESLNDLSTEKAETVASDSEAADRNKEGFRPVNFLSPEDDCEFEFLDLDEDEDNKE